MEATPNLLNLLENMRAYADLLLSEGVEPQFLQMAMCFERCRGQWLRVEEELGGCREMLTKAETERGALEVKLKHARNQVDVEVRRRQKAEAECEKLDRQIQLIRDLLVCEGSTSLQLNEEQRSALAFLNARTRTSNLNNSRRLTTIDESTSILSDISYDKTDDSLDWDSSAIRTVRLRKRQKRRSSRLHVEGPSDGPKRSRSTGRKSEKANESIVAKTTLTVPADGGPIQAVSTIQAIPYRVHGTRNAVHWETDTDTLSCVSDAPSAPPSVVCTPTPAKASIPQKAHAFVSKTVIKPESCIPCGKRIKFGKLSLKCQVCRVVAHVECREKCPLPCNPISSATPTKNVEGILSDYVPSHGPMIPQLVIQCVSEIEQRGLRETGLYRISGSDRVVRDLKERFMRGGNSVPPLGRVDDIHAVTGLLKDFLRKLKEPLLTCRLNRAFMEAAEILDEDNSIAAMYQNISDLPQPNRDTLAFLILHLQRVALSPDTKMDNTNLARVFGPTIVGHAVTDPDHMTLLTDTQRQPRVVERLLSLPAEYWRQFLMAQDNVLLGSTNGNHGYHTPEQKVSILGPVTTPEHQMSKTPSSSSLSQRVKSTLSTPIFGSRSKASAGLGRQGNFFSSPMLK
ncbi:rac GTPase-activating protein 1-like [Alosa sapidissima]|uniref:rac GTPase-activating protein 1-like n=1 Tax=Alosa sapidissima TaxID=34773 RepID=UPI001C080CAC|nr:rac GTPase-activating protein 1-like [Alosa sapidissima]